MTLLPSSHLRLPPQRRAALASAVALLALSIAACTAAQDLGDRPGTDSPDGAIAGEGLPEAGPDGTLDGGDVGPSSVKSDSGPSVVLTANPTTVTAAGKLTLDVSVGNASTIKNVVIYSDSTAIATLTTAPYRVTQAVTQSDNGTYVFSAEASDASGNVGRSAPVIVTVDIAGPPLPSVPTFVAAGASAVITGATSLALAAPGSVQANDFLIATIDAQETAGSATLTTPAGWTLLGGFPIHNLGSAHPPYVIPATQNHGTWVLTKFADAAEPATTSFAFAAAATARGVMVAYRGVDTSAPIHDKSGLGFYGTGGTNGLGGGNTTLTQARQVNLIATGATDHATYTNVLASGSITERFNSGEQPNGLNLIVHDQTLTFKIYSGPSIANKQSPSGTSDGFLFSATTLVLKPQ